jgi:hypothetical protein
MTTKIVKVVMINKKDQQNVTMKVAKFACFTGVDQGFMKILII